MDREVRSAIQHLKEFDFGLHTSRARLSRRSKWAEIEIICINGITSGECGATGKTLDGPVVIAKLRKGLPVLTFSHDHVVLMQTDQLPICVGALGRQVYGFDSQSRIGF